MKPLVGQIADAVVAELNSHDFGVPFTARRIYRPSQALDEFDQLQVLAVPRALTSEADARDADQIDVLVDLAVRKRVPPKDDDAVDELLVLVDRIWQFLNRRSLAAMPAARFIGVTSEPIYDPEDLDQRHLFTAVLTITYRLIAASPPEDGGGAA